MHSLEEIGCPKQWRHLCPCWPNLMDSYRIVTITPETGKLLDGIFNKCLQYAKECLSIGDPFKNGLNSYAINIIVLLNGIIGKCKFNGRPLYTCFINFKYAFDLIKWSSLFYTISCWTSGALENSCLWFKACYEMQDLVWNRGSAVYSVHIGGYTWPIYCMLMI